MLSVNQNIWIKLVLNEVIGSTYKILALDVEINHTV